MTTMNYLLDGASSACQIDWNVICWTKVEKQVRRLQVRIAKAVREVNNRVYFRPLKGLSHVLGNSHAWFLGELRLVTASAYPAFVQPS